MRVGTASTWQYAWHSPKNSITSVILPKKVTSTMPSVVTRIRIPRRTRDTLKRNPNATLAQVLTNVMNSYISGEHQLPKLDQEDIVTTTTTMDRKVVDAFTEIAKANGYSFDAAVRVALANALNK